MEKARPRAVLLLACRDQKGLVAAVSDFIFRHNGNILHADQHTDTEKGVFLQRVEWDLDGFQLGREEARAAFRSVADRFGMTWTIHFSDEVSRMAILATREAHCLHDLLVRWRLGEFRAEIPLVISNHETLRPVAESFGVPYACFPVDPDAGQAQAARVLQKLRDERVDVVVLARYMQILPESLVQAFPGRMINIHHSFLPAFVGARPYHQAHARGVKIVGATAHYVTPELDQGPIIEQDVVRISHRDSVDDIIRKGRDLEKIVLARAVHLHLSRRVVAYGAKTVVFD
jgi:formyltetrahydrofolate deformylase